MKMLVHELEKVDFAVLAEDLTVVVDVNGRIPKLPILPHQR